MEATGRVRLKSVLLYILLFGLCYSAFLVVTFPASLAWRLVESETLVPEALSIEQVGGTVWSGNARLSIRLSPLDLHSSGLLNWQIKPAAWLQGRAAGVVQLESDIGNLQGEVSVSPDALNLLVNSASLQLERLNPALQRQRVRLVGTVSMKNTELSAENGVITGSRGQLYWPGGRVTYPVGRQVRSGDFPPFSGLIGFEDGSVTIGIKDQGAPFDSITGILSSDGWFKAEVRRRLVDLAGEHWKKNVPEDQVIASVKRKLY